MVFIGPKITTGNRQKALLDNPTGVTKIKVTKSKFNKYEEGPFYE